MRDCPKCAKAVDGATCPFCGYSELPATSRARERDPDWWRCVHEDRGQRCANPGSVSPTVHGGAKGTSGPWFCWQHVPAMQQFKEGEACAPPMGFAALKALVKRPYDFEAEAERIALQSEEVK